MKIKRFEFNMFPVNCYVLWDETNEAVVIDPGCFYEEEKSQLKRFIIDKGLTIKHLLNSTWTTSSAIHSCSRSSA
jgi:glyoxylase-like metal-dependent hydrolase (beta-lactamase superfamily II)